MANFDQKQFSLLLDAAKKTDLFTEHNELIKFLLSSDDQFFFDKHYDLLKERTNTKLHQRIRAAFNKRGSSASTLLEKKLSCEKNTDVLGDVVQIVGHRRQIDALPIIRKLANHDSSWIRYNVIIVLGWMGEKSDFFVLRNSLKNDKDHELRGYSATAMRQMYVRDKSIGSEIINAISIALSEEENEYTIGFFLIVIQDISGINLGIKESIETRSVVGDVLKAKSIYLAKRP